MHDDKNLEVDVSHTSTHIESSHLDDGVRVYGDAVIEDSCIDDKVIIRGSVRVIDCNLSDSVAIEGSARVTTVNAKGRAMVGGSAQLYDCELADDAKIYGNTYLADVSVRGTSCVFGKADLHNISTHSITLAGNCKFGGNATFDKMTTPEYFVRKYGANKVKVQGKEIILTDVWDMG